ncbi:MAG: hypothetical protein KDK26_18845 [Roseivivax sp.]|nr:hypothetical protein [Roseivivax sp.]
MTAYESPGPEKANWRDAISSPEEITVGARRGRLSRIIMPAGSAAPRWGGLCALGPEPVGTRKIKEER